MEKEQVSQYFKYLPSFEFMENTATDSEKKLVTINLSDVKYLQDSIVNLMLTGYLFYNNNLYDNKKLIVESLPAYMFIQPTQPPEPEPPSHQENKKPDSPSKSGGSTSTREDLESYCTGICMEYSDFYGTMMLDMGCYAKCVGDI